MLGPQYWHFIAAAYMTAGSWSPASTPSAGCAGAATATTGSASSSRSPSPRSSRRSRWHSATASPASVFQKQPAKFAAIEIVWTTGPNQAEYLYGRLQPDGTIDGGIKIPGLDSFLAGFSRRHRGTRASARCRRTNRPTAGEATIAHWAFDTMVGIGTVLLLLALWYGLAWLRRRDLPRSRWFYRCAAVAGDRLGRRGRGRLDHRRGRPPAVDRLGAHEGGRGGDQHQRRPDLDLVRDPRRRLRADRLGVRGPAAADAAALAAPGRAAGPGGDRRAGGACASRRSRRGRRLRRDQRRCRRLGAGPGDRRVRLWRRGRLRRRLLGPDRRRRRTAAPGPGRWSTTRWRRSGRPTTSGWSSCSS